MRYLIFAADGRCVSEIETHREITSDDLLDKNWKVVASDKRAADAYLDVSVQPPVVAEFPQKPLGDYQFDIPSKCWVPTKHSDEQLISVARAMRAQMLAQSDWTQLPDVSLTTRESWAAYRQALRNITAQAGFPRNIVWPIPPA